MNTLKLLSTSHVSHSNLRILPLAVGEFRQLEIRPRRFTDKPKRRARFSLLMEKDFKRFV